MKRQIPFLLLISTVLLAMVSMQVQAARFFGLGDVDSAGRTSCAWGVSVDGSVVVGSAAGIYETAVGDIPFRWTSTNGAQAMGNLIGGRTYGVSADGSVVVGFSTTSTTGWKAFRWVDLNGNGLVDPDEKLNNHPEFYLGDMPGGGSSFLASDISADGSVVVGNGNSTSGHEAFRWTEESGPVGLGDLPGGQFYSAAEAVSIDGSFVVGFSRSALGVEACRWNQHGEIVGLDDLPGGEFKSYAFDISADGSVVVGYGYSDSGQEAYRWTSGSGMVGLGDLPGGDFSSCAYAVSADGSVIVGTSESSSAWLGDEAFIWDQTNGMRNLRDVLVNDYGLDLTGWTLYVAKGISDDGLTIVGSGNNPDGYQEGWIAILPGPQVVYVDADAPAGGDGTSWDTAFNYLQDALAVAEDGNEIWMAEGIYTPDVSLANPGGTGDRQATFQLKNGVAVKGGYAGYGEPDPNARDIELYETNLSGDLADNDGPDFANNGENSYHVVTGSGTDATAVLDGFTVTGGNADDLSNCPDCHTAGAGMFNENASPTITNCTFRENFVGNDADLSWCGAGMYNYQSSPTLTNCTFRGNSIIAPDGATGGGMHNEFSSPTLTECSFIDNSAGEIGDGGGMHNLYESSPTLTNCTFSGNLGRKGGGMTNRWNSTPILINCTFSGNSSTIRGGGISNWQTGQGPTLTDCIFSGNSADHGGGIYNGNNSSLTVTGCTFSENTAEDGGGIYNDQSSPTLTDCTFSDNYSEGYGGGVGNFDSNSILINCTFGGNTAEDGGGGMYNDQSSPTLTDCTFISGNEAGSGGGMYNDQSSPTLSNCTFSNNRANGGGGMYNKDSSLILIDCSFSGNWTNLDGAGMSNKDSSLILTNCMFDDNRTDDGSGGGMYNSGGSLTVTGCTFINNDTMWDGGGIDNIGVNSTLTNCIFAGNFYAYHGGGLSNSSGSTVLTNCAFTANLGEYGGGMYNWSGSSATLRNCTFSQNSASNNGGGIGNSSDYNLSMSNCIVWGNTPDEIYGGAGIPVVTYSDVQGGWPGLGNIDIDPLFVDPCNGDYHLLPGSPCIDTGDPCYVPAPNETDLDDNTRVINGRIDMGAYESDYIQARLRLLPRTINRQSKMKRVMAWMQLPEGITKDQIDQDTPLLLYPGPLEPINQYIFEHGQKGNKRTNIFILYDKAELLAAVPDNGLVDVQVVGMLTTGRYFYGNGFITLIDRQQPHQWRLLKNR